jgi:hypothetical protein
MCSIISPVEADMTLDTIYRIILPLLNIVLKTLFWLKVESLLKQVKE